MKISVPEQRLERDRVAHLNHCVEHAQRQPALIETEVSRFPDVRVILGFVAIQKLEVVTDVDLVKNKPHEPREHGMVQQVRIVEKCERRKSH